MKKYLLLLFMLMQGIVFAQVYSSAQNNTLILRVPVWVFLESQPGLMSPTEGGRSLPPAQAIRELSAFLMSGITAGWQFSYTPADKQRAVQEHFVLTPIFSISPQDPRISLTNVHVDYPFAYCWAEYPFSTELAKRFSSGKGIRMKKAQGKGEGERKSELDGIYQAYYRAIKNAIRSAMQKELQNKPKEITGEVLLHESPRLFIAHGNFIATVSISLSVRDVIPYTRF